MNSLEFIEKLIKKCLKSYENFMRLYKINPDKEAFNKCATIRKEELFRLKQIKDELEIMELIENGWSSIEQTVSGEKIIKFEKLNLDDWLKVWKTLEEIGLKKALEAGNNNE